MEKVRCAWCGTDELYQKYHDEEWGKLVTDDATMFEFLILESFQAGLSWITILRKRENFQKAFDNFSYKKIANYSEDKIEELMKDTGIIRNRLKVLAAISNAQKFMELQKRVREFLWLYFHFYRRKQDCKSLESSHRSTCNYRII